MSTIPLNFRIRFLVAAALLCASVVASRATTVDWGPVNAQSSTGLLDATRIPLSTGTTPIRYTNINGQGYDIVVTTSGLTQDGLGDYLGDSAWWFAGSGYNNSIYSTVKFQFFVSGTNVPIGIAGTDLVFQDAEDQERFGNFSYNDEFGNNVPVLFSDSMFSYSYSPNYYDGYTEVVNDAPEEGGTQEGKSIEANMTATTITGFTFGAHRQTTSAGSVLMMGLGDLNIPPIVQWRETYFGLNLSTSGTAGDTANPAGDGIPNLLKYAFGLNPTMAETSGLPVVTATSGYLQVSFNRIVADTDITYIVETSYDLVTWEEGSTYTESGDFPVLGDTYEVSNVQTAGVEAIVVRDTVALSSVPHRYIRVVITRP